MNPNLIIIGWYRFRKNIEFLLFQLYVALLRCNLGSRKKFKNKKLTGDDFIDFPNDKEVNDEIERELELEMRSMPELVVVGRYPKAFEVLVHEKKASMALIQKSFPGRFGFEDDEAFVLQIESLLENIALKTGYEVVIKDNVEVFKTQAAADMWEEQSKIFEKLVRLWRAYSLFITIVLLEWILLHVFS